MQFLQLPHWLIIAGALLVGTGLIGLLTNKRGGEQADPPPGEAT
jgi:hypothetical protein